MKKGRLGPYKQKVELSTSEHPREDVWTGGQFHAGLRRGKEGGLPGGFLATLLLPSLPERTGVCKENRGKERDCKDHAQHLLPR